MAYESVVFEDLITGGVTTNIFGGPTLADMLRNINAFGSHEPGIEPPPVDPTPQGQPPADPVVELSAQEQMLLLHGGYAVRVPQIIPPLTAVHTLGGRDGKWVRNSAGTCWDGRKWLSQPIIEYCHPMYFSEVSADNFWHTYWLVDGQGDDYNLGFDYAVQAKYADGADAGWYSSNVAYMKATDVPFNDTGVSMDIQFVMPDGIGGLLDLNGNLFPGQDFALYVGPPAVPWYNALSYDGYSGIYPDDPTLGLSRIPLRSVRTFGASYANRSTAPGIHTTDEIPVFKANVAVNQPTTYTAATIDPALSYIEKVMNWSLNGSGGLNFTFGWVGYAADDKAIWSDLVFPADVVANLKIGMFNPVIVKSIKLRAHVG